MATRHRFPRVAMLLVALLVWIALPVLAQAQTRITAPKNKYTPEQDVQLGQKAAEQVLQEFPLVNDQAAQSYLQRIGQRLVDAIPPEFQHQQFHYTFRVVNAKDLNAFALPGGPMFVVRGMIQAAQNEGELAGVMAHELSHVALRHGTAQATKATPYEIGTIAGQILGSIVGGTAGQVIATGSRFGIGTAFLRFSREYEKDADILGSQIMARAGYDPRDMAAVFQMLEKQGGGGGPEWLSDHPNPGNRYAYITQEAQRLAVNRTQPPTGDLRTVQSDLRRLPPAPTMAQLEKAAQNGNPQGNAGAVATDGRRGGVNGEPVGTSGSFPAPSSRYRTYDADVFQIAVPENWEPDSQNNVVRFAPAGATVEANGQSAFLLGVEVGITQVQGGDLRSATEDFAQQLIEANPNLRPQTDSFQRTTLAGQQGLRMAFNNTNENGNREVVVLETTQLDDGSLFYALNVAPQSQFATYQPTFRRITGSIRLSGR